MEFGSWILDIGDWILSIIHYPLTTIQRPLSTDLIYRERISYCILVLKDITV